LPKISDDAVLLDATTANRKALRSLRKRRCARHLSHRRAVTRDGKRAFVALWNASEMWSSISRAARWRASWPCSSRQPIAPGTHLVHWRSRPTRKHSTWRLQSRRRCRRQCERRTVSVKGYSTPPSGTKLFGASRWLSLERRWQPALRATWHRFRCCVRHRQADARAAKNGMVEPAVHPHGMDADIDRLPFFTSGGTLYLATAKGKEQGQIIFLPAELKPRPAQRPGQRLHRKLLYGSLATLDERDCQ